MTDIECVVVGAGAVGLAVARRLALAGREVLILEATETIGSGVSSRNSEVIHAGIYYPTGSLKHRLCVAGRDALYTYCAEHGVPHRRLGKLIVATDDTQMPALRKLHDTARANGVEDVVPIDGAGIRELEPAVRGVAGLLSRSTGIIDSHALMLAYLGNAEAAGAVLALRSPVESGRVTDDGFALDVGGADPTTLTCRLLVNAAGLGAQPLALRLRGLPAATVPPLHYAKGVYFTLIGRSPFRHLVYPMPDGATLGVHVTLDLGGQAKFGPDIEWVDGLDYDVDPARAAQFARAIRRYWPDLPDGALQPGYSGIRPKVAAKGAPPHDFVIQGPRDHGVVGLVNLYGIESPGLTASLAIGDMVEALLEQD
jgi:L-2-hydroxyglutarate oxidase LhgO